MVTDNHHTRRFVSSSADDDDIISNLPEDLINPILEWLPVKDAVRTSVLSKKWRYRWTTMKSLAFDNHFSQQFLNMGAFSCHGFVRVISQIMIKHQGPILKFVLHISKEIVLDSFQEVDQWMLILSRNNVRELQIVKFNQFYQIPTSVFSCRELRVLGLYKCILKPPLEFQGFPNLEVISLLCVNFGASLGGTVINLPQLKRFKLFSCVNVNNFNIKAENLQYLRILAAEKFPNSLPHVVQCLEELEFTSFSFGDLNQLQGALCMLQNSPNLKGLRVTHVPMGPAQADLELTSDYIESLDCLDQTLFMLKTVEMTSLEGSRPELLFVKLLLDHSPHLESMIIRPSATVDAEKRLNIAKDVMLFPRASSKAKMVYLDPQP
ncbi:putative F-box domain, FBD domain, leucine-rich repeat domain superfamily [Helianthus anomalus]